MCRFKNFKNSQHKSKVNKVLLPRNASKTFIINCFVPYAEHFAPYTEHFALYPTFEKLLTGIKDGRKAQKIGVVWKIVYEIDPGLF